MRKAMLMLSVVAAMTFLIPNVTLACECVRPADETAEQAKTAFLKEVKDATAIFSGEVIESDMLMAKFKVDKVWKGDLKDEVIILTGAKRHGDGSYSRWSCDYDDYRLGEKYIIWADRTMDGLKAHVCSRTGLVDGADQDISELNKLKASGSKLLMQKPQQRGGRSRR